MTQSDLDFSESTARMFSKNLLTFPEALEYVKERGISVERIERGEVGFCPPYYDYPFPLLKGRVVVPIRDVHGRVVAFAGRKYEPMQEMTEHAIWQTLGYKPSLAEQTYQNWVKGKWINERFPKSHHLFHMDVAKAFAREFGYIIIVEGYFDALVLASEGLPNVAAVCGTSLSEYHISIIARYCNRIVLLLDADAAGNKGVERCLPIIEEANMTPHVLTLPEGVDPDEFVLSYGGDFLHGIITKMIEDERPTKKIVVKK